MKIFESVTSRLYYLPIQASQSYPVMLGKLVNPDIFGLWHDHLGHPGTIMMRKIVRHSF